MKNVKKFYKPRASERGRITRHQPFGRILLTLSRDLPDGGSVEVSLHATKGIRSRRNPPDTLRPGYISGER